MPKPDGVSSSGMCISSFHLVRARLGLGLRVEVRLGLRLGLGLGLGSGSRSGRVPPREEDELCRHLARSAGPAERRVGEQAVRLALVLTKAGGRKARAAGLGVRPRLQLHDS